MVDDIKDVQILEQVLHNDEGIEVGKIAILVCMDLSRLNKAVARYVGDVKHNQFIESNLMNPWTRVIISGINKLDYHKLGTDPELIKKLRNRNIKLNDILNG